MRNRSASVLRKVWYCLPTFLILGLVNVPDHSSVNIGKHSANQQSVQSSFPQTLKLDLKEEEEKSKSSFCQSNEHSQFATRHTGKQLIEEVSFSFNEVHELFNLTQRNRELHAKFVLFRLDSGNVTVEGTETADDFTKNCAAHLLQTIKILQTVVALPNVHFVFSSLAALDQAANLQSNSTVPIFSACSSDSPGFKKLFFPRVTSVLSPRRLYEELSEFTRKEQKLFFRGALSGPEREVLFKKYQGVDFPAVDVALTSVPEGAPCDNTRKAWCAGIPAKWVSRSDLLVNATERVPLEESLARYRYILSVDGVGCADRVPTLLSSANLVFIVASDFHEFWYADLVPFKHYIPVKKDLSDLLDVIQWVNDQTEETLLDIVARANKYVKTFLSTEAMKCYYVHVLQKYARLLRHSA